MKSYDKLEKIVGNIVNRIMGDPKELPDNFDRAAINIYPSEYGVHLQVTFLMKKPFSQSDSDFFLDYLMVGILEKK